MPKIKLLFILILFQFTLLISTQEIPHQSHLHSDPHQPPIPLSEESTNCAPQCLTCQKSEDSCTQCKGENRLIQDLPNCKCKPGYYDSQLASGDCLQCSDLCETCDAHKCLSCKQDQNRFLSSNGHCVCKPGYFQENSNESKCQVCYNYKQYCLAKCPDNTFQDEETFICRNNIKVRQSIGSQYFFPLLVVFLILLIGIFLLIVRQTRKEKQKLEKDLEIRKNQIDKKRKQQKEMIKQQIEDKKKKKKKQSIDKLPTAIDVAYLSCISEDNIGKDLSQNQKKEITKQKLLQKHKEGGKISQKDIIQQKNSSFSMLHIFENSTRQLAQSHNDSVVLNVSDISDLYIKGSENDGNK